MQAGNSAQKRESVCIDYFYARTGININRAVIINLINMTIMFHCPRCGHVEALGSSFTPVSRLPRMDRCPKCGFSFKKPHDLGKVISLEAAHMKKEIENAKKQIARLEQQISDLEEQKKKE